MKKRGTYLIVGILIFGALVNMGNLFWISVIRNEELKTEAEMQQLSDTPIPAERGTIYDSNMTVLASSASAWTVFADPSKIMDADLAKQHPKEAEEKAQKRREAILEYIPELLDVDKKDLEEIISDETAEYRVIKRKVDYNIKQELDKIINEHGLYGVISTDPGTRRYYPLNNFASTIIGSLNSEGIGRAGIELEYESTLTGTEGRRITAQNAVKGAMESDFETVFDAQRGSGIVLTIDKNIQHYLEKGLRQAVIDNEALSAYGIVMEVDTGAVLAMATMPDFDLNEPGVLKDKTVLKQLSKIKDDDERQKAMNERVYLMWRNKAVSDTYEPGSVFKIFTAAAGLEEGVVNLNSTYTCTGKIQVAENLIHCHNVYGHGTQTLTQGLMNSCNPFFITIGQKLGTDRFFKYFEAFGFTEETDIDLPGEATPRADITYHSLENMGLPQVSSSAFGQTFQVSAMQMITAVSAVANGGNLMKPYVVKALVDSNGNTVSETKPTVRRQVISESTSKTVLSMMEQVVSEGTGRNAYIPGYRVAGKTGTSEKLTVDGEYIASFVGCAPANDPKIAVLIVIDEPQGEVHGGGAIAAPVAGSVIEQTLKYMNIEPAYTDDELSKLNAVTPSVTDMPVSKAQETLSSKGFAARVIGNGGSVVVQYPSKGQKLSYGGVVILYTENGKTSREGKIPELTGLSISEANERAISAGFNIKISGAALDSEVVSYRQSMAAGTKCELGSTVTVYFKTTSGVQDD